jgi:hypothetical protein
MSGYASLPAIKLSKLQTCQPNNLGERWNRTLFGLFRGQLRVPTLPQIFRLAKFAVWTVTNNTRDGWVREDTFHAKTFLTFLTHSREMPPLSIVGSSQS